VTFFVRDHVLSSDFMNLTRRVLRRNRFVREFGRRNKETIPVFPPRRWFACRAPHEKSTHRHTLTDRC
jgi:hypothetical protein